MQIFISTTNDKIIALEVNSSDSIQSVKQKIQNNEQIQSNQQKLYFADKELVDTQILSDYNIINGDTLRLSVLIIGPWITSHIEPDTNIKGIYNPIS